MGITLTHTPMITTPKVVIFPALVCKQAGRVGGGGEAMKPVIKLQTTILNLCLYEP